MQANTFTEITNCEKKLLKIRQQQSLLNQMARTEQEHLTAITEQAKALLEGHPGLNYENAMIEAEKELAPFWKATQKTANRLRRAVQRSKEAAAAAIASPKRGGYISRVHNWAKNTVKKSEENAAATTTPPQGSSL